MLTFFFKKIVPMIVALAVLIEGTSAGAWLFNQPYDSAVLGSVLLIGATVSAFGSFVYWYYIKPAKQAKGQK